MPFTATYWFVVADPARDRVRRAAARAAGTARALPSDRGPLATVGRDLAVPVRDAWRAFTGSRPAFVGVIVSLLRSAPMRCRSRCSRTSRWNLASDHQIAVLNVWSTLIFALACVAGGWLSDRYGRRRMLALFVFLTVVPTLWLAWTMQQDGWILPVDPNAAGRPQPTDALRTRSGVLAFNVFRGLHGVRSALFMDDHARGRRDAVHRVHGDVEPVISYTSWWQGLSIVRWGYPVTLAIDATVGLVSLFLLPLMKPTRRPRTRRRPDRGPSAARSPTGCAKSTPVRFTPTGEIDEASSHHIRCALHLRGDRPRA
jgi:PAT family beta-lactamase induction signal transducer AmpG